jgi:transcriptional regulator with XRE-family HTH domain
METDTPTRADADLRLARRLRDLRLSRRWSLDELASLSGLSRASLSRIENGDVSPTAAALGRLAGAHGLTFSRLIAEVESEAPDLVARADQRQWIDPATGFRRRSVSPPAPSYDCEVLECELPAGALIDYPIPPRVGLEHHLVLQEGELELRLGEAVHRLAPGDCLRYKLAGASRFFASGRSAARYLLVIR